MSDSQVTATAIAASLGDTGAREVLEELHHEGDHRGCSHPSPTTEGAVAQ